MNIQPNATPSREMTREERTAIRKLVTTLCANYDAEHGCLLLDCHCVMLGKCWTSGYCKYFREAVLPTETFLEAMLTGRVAHATDICAACGKPFVPEGKQVYCSPQCQSEGNRRRSRERMRKKRRNKGV